uniref:Pre-rRNA-processing protein TSR2 n=1 Tax=Compsopogon caeruleus TaxID=31354 RepID=A0A7S1THZ6_9RHOD|mmetsp:Transcript_8638/g.17499  ORF Transcript_8638/g.17499 Transcript_8638/m.17499 type:complete len:178 (+) Transcript_8638:196-729(+)
MEILKSVAMDLDVFRRGVSALFLRWTALQLAVEHGSSGANFVARDMLATLLALTESSQGTEDFPNETAVEMLYDGFDRMEVDVEDGSVEEIVSLVRELRKSTRQGDFSLCDQLVSRAQQVGLDAPIRLALESNSNAGPPQEAENGGSMDVDERRDEWKERIIDEDGFELVRRGRKPG